MLKKYSLIGLLVLALVLSGCSDDKKETPKEKTEKKKSERKAKTAERVAEEFCDKVDTRFFWGDSNMNDYYNTVAKVDQRLNDVEKKYKTIKSLIVGYSKNEPDSSRKLKMDALVSDLDDILRVLPEYNKLRSEDFKASGIATLSDVTTSIPQWTQEELNNDQKRFETFMNAVGPLIKIYNENEEHFWLNMSALFPFDCLKNDPVRPGGLLPHYLEQEVQTID